MNLLALIPAAWRRWLAGASAIIVLTILAIAQARTNARLRDARKADKDRLDTMEEARDVRRSIQAASRADRADRLARWMRSD